MLGTHLGPRNLWCVIYCCLGLGWTMGWVRFYVKTVFGFRGILVFLGWGQIVILMLLDLGGCYPLVEGAKSWLHQKSHFDWKRSAAVVWLLDMVVRLLYRIMLQDSGCNFIISKRCGRISIYEAWIRFNWGIMLVAMLHIAMSFCRGISVIYEGARLPYCMKICGVELGMNARRLGWIFCCLDSLRRCWVLSIEAWAGFVPIYGSLGWGYNRRMNVYDGVGLSLLCIVQFGPFNNSMGQIYYRKMMTLAHFSVDILGHLERLKIQWTYFKLKDFWWVCKISFKPNMFGTLGLLCNFLEVFDLSRVGIKWACHIIIISSLLCFDNSMYVLVYISNMGYLFLGGVGPKPTWFWSACASKAGWSPIQWWLVKLKWCSTSWGCGKISDGRSRFFCLPRVGCIISYFWSPKPVLGDDTGGMPP
ncbi:hypothetical protein HanIR_Chr16g0805401 [Helianthus annuus]|nr:hypothetical protein HanIR_Chr16g0805401 [Helianthus annuus]